MAADYSKDRASIVSRTVRQIVDQYLRAWADGDQSNGDLAAVLDEIEMLLRELLRNEFEEIVRQTRDEITLAD